MPGVGINPGTTAKIEGIGFRQSFNLNTATNVSMSKSFDIINTNATRKTVYLGIYPERAINQPILAFGGSVIFDLNNQTMGEIPFVMNDIPDSSRFTLNPFGSMPYPSNGIIPPNGILVGSEAGFRLLCPVTRIVHCDKIHLVINNSVVSTTIIVSLSGILVCSTGSTPPCTASFLYLPLLPINPGSVRLTFGNKGYHDFQVSPVLGQIRENVTNVQAGDIDYPTGEIEMTSGTIGLSQPYVGSYSSPSTLTSALYRLEFYVVNEYPYA